MAHRIIATQDRTIYEADGITIIVNLIDEQEVITADEDLKEALLLWGWAKLYDDTKPLPPKGVGVYEYGLSYPKGRQVIKDNAMYKSNTITSTAWVEAEWDIILQGA